MTASPMELTAKLFDVTGSVKTKMAASKLPKCSSQFLHRIATKFLRLTYALVVHLSNKEGGNVVRPNRKKRKKPEVKNPRWRPHMRSLLLNFADVGLLSTNC